MPRGKVNDLRANRHSAHAGLQSAIFCAPVLTYFGVDQNAEAKKILPGPSSGEDEASSLLCDAVKPRFVMNAL
jgi:hypothetical protein